MMIQAITPVRIAAKSMMPNATSPMIHREIGMNINAIAISTSMIITLQSILPTIKSVTLLTFNPDRREYRK